MRRQSRAARPAAVGGGRAGEAGRSAAARAGGADGPKAPTSWGPGRAGAPTPQPARGRSKARPAVGGLSWPCFAGGVPRATAGGWQAPQARRPEPPPTLRSSCRRRRLGGGDQPPHYPDCRRQAGRAAAPPPRRVGRGTARRPRGRVGRALPKGARTGAPFPCPVTVSRDKREKGAPQALPCLLNRGNPAWLSKVGGLPLPPPGKVHIIESPAPVGKPTKGFQPFTRQGPWALDPSPGLVPGFAWIQTGAPTHGLAKGLVWLHFAGRRAESVTSGLLCFPVLGKPQALFQFYKLFCFC